MLKPTTKILTLLMGANAAPAFANTWLVNWAPLAQPVAHPVPLGPWLAPLVALMLAAAAFGYLRKRAGAGPMALFALLLAGAMMFYADDRTIAAQVPDFTITTATGSEVFNCQTSMGMPMSIGTDVAGGVTLTLTLQNGGGPADTPDECQTGTQLQPGGATCTLYFTC